MHRIALHTIQSVDNLPLIAVKATLGKHKGYFIVDTGAQICLIGDHLTDFEYEEIDFEKQDASVMGILDNETLNVTIIFVKNLKLARRNFDLGPSFVMPIQHIQDKIKKKYQILGIIGNSFLEFYEAIIDYRSKELFLNL